MNKELSKEEIIKKYNLFEVIPLSPEPKIYFNERIKTAMQEYSDQEKRQLEKENKELKEKYDDLAKEKWKLQQQVNELLFMPAFTKFGAEQYMENWKPKIITNITNSNY